VDEESSQPAAVEVTWDLQRLQEELCKGAAHQYVHTIAMLRRCSPDAIREFNAVFIANKTYFKHLGVATPGQLVRALAEIETNAFGGTMLVAGDDERASITYVYCAEWAAIEELSNMTWDERVSLAEHFVHAMQELAGYFGFSAEVSFDSGVPTATFSR
jgi:hypothetical protein